MILHLLRHGQAEPKNLGIPDRERVLTPEGSEETFDQAKKWKKRLKGVSTILTSPYPRTLQTAEIFAEVLKLKNVIRVETALSAGTDGASVLRFLKGQVLAPEVLLVGHEPWLTGLASWLISGSGSCSIRLRKAGLMSVEVDLLAPAGGRLLTLR